MSFVNQLFGEKLNTPYGSPFQMITAYQPVFSSWGGMMYESELIRASVDSRARHIMKLAPNFIGAAGEKFSSCMRLGPNRFYTWSQYLYRLSSLLDIYNNVFLMPIYDRENKICGIWPVLPSACELIDVEGEAWIRFNLFGGQCAAVPFDECQIMTRHQLNDDVFGEPNTALDGTLGLLDLQRQATEAGMKNGAGYRFMASLNTDLNPEDIVKTREEFTKNNLETDKSEGVLLWPWGWKDIKQLDKNTPFTIGAEERQIIENNIFLYFGTNTKILTNAAIGDELDAFFEGAIEPFMVQASEKHTRLLYTQREISTGNRFMLTADRMQYMSTTNKIAFVKEMQDRGNLTINEARELFNLVPQPVELGEKSPIRGEYYFTDGSRVKDAENKTSSALPAPEEGGNNA